MKVPKGVLDILSHRCEGMPPQTALDNNPEATWWYVLPEHEELLNAYIAMAYTTFGGGEDYYKGIGFINAERYVGGQLEFSGYPTDERMFAQVNLAVFTKRHYRDK